MALQKAKLTKTQLPDVHFGTVQTVGEIYSQFVKPALPSPDVVRHWHTLLLEYVKQPDAILFIRRYASAAQTEYHKLRRGFLTLDPTGFGYAYCDNYFPQLIFAQVLAGNKPTLEELRAAINSRNFPVSVRLTQNEKEQLTFGRTTAPPLGTRGWKLSHLYSVNQGFVFHAKSTFNTIFPRGEYAWWGGADKIYRLPTTVNEDTRAKMTAHFLRAVHPANYFLSPAKKHQVFAGQDIGESPVLLAYVHAQFRELYGSIMDELEPLLLPGPSLWHPVAADTKLELTTQEAKQSSPVAPSPKPMLKNLGVQVTATSAPYPIIFSTATHSTATAAQFKQELLLHKKALLIRSFKHGGPDVTLIWDAGDMIPESSLISNIRGRYRGAKAAEISAIHAEIVYQ